MLLTTIFYHIDNFCNEIEKPAVQSRAGEQLIDGIVALICRYRIRANYTAADKRDTFFNQG